MTTTILDPRAGVADEIGREDDHSGHNGSGYERDETDQYHRLVRQLVTDGDHRARSAGRRARRTLAEMAPATPDSRYFSSPARSPCGRATTRVPCAAAGAATAPTARPASRPASRPALAASADRG
ncbi:hypothetical protein [Streptomyces sp. NPDC001880]